MARDLLCVVVETAIGSESVYAAGAMVMLEDSRVAAERSGIDLAVAAIERYVAAHPAAADNAQGVAQWWLPAMGVDLPVEVVHRALEALSQSGALTRSVLPDGGTVYRGAQRDPASDRIDDSDGECGVGVDRRRDTTE